MVMVGVMLVVNTDSGPMLLVVGLCHTGGESESHILMICFILVIGLCHTGGWSVSNFWCHTGGLSVSYLELVCVIVVDGLCYTGGWSVLYL